jgi:flagellar operon protein (TIGR03826 family)
MGIHAYYTRKGGRMMGDIRNCKECGRLFQYTGFSKVCPKCKEEDEKNFKKVKEYLYDHPRAILTEVSEALEVPEDKILRYLREGRLEIVGEQGSLILECERCGRAIRTGRFCEECAIEIEKEFNQSLTSQKPSLRRVEQRMYTAEMKSKKK